MRRSMRLSLLAATTALALSVAAPSQALSNKGKASTKPAHHNGLGALAIIIAALAALVVLACAAWAVARQRAYEPHWWLSLRHAMAEAGFRTSATWAEFTDWARLGR